MNTIQFPRNLFKLYLLLSLLILNSCAFYKTLEVTPVTSESLSAAYEIRKNVVIHNTDKSEEYLLKDLVISKDSISGKIHPSPEGWKHKPMAKSFVQDLNTFCAHDPLSTIHIYSLLNEIKPDTFSMHMADISRVEIHRQNTKIPVIALLTLPTALTVASVITIIRGGVAGGGVSYNYGGGSSGSLCPLVVSYDENGNRFHGSLFPGSIFKSLKRDDFLFLNDYVSHQGKLRLKVFNAFEETEYIDQLQLLEINHKGFDKLGISNSNKIVAYNEPLTIPTFECNTAELNQLLAANDGFLYDFDDTPATNQLNSITLTFDRDQFSNHPYLMITGKQTEWLETITQIAFFCLGKSYDNWIKRKNKSDVEHWKRTSNRQGSSLNVYIWEKDEWVFAGAHYNAGVLTMRNLLLPLHLENINEPTINIKLECAYKFWEIDFVGLTDDWTTDLVVQDIPFTFAIDEQGKDVSEKIKSSDEDYHVQNSSGTFINLQADGISPKDNCTLALKGTGYYQPIKNYEHNADLKFFKTINSKLGLQNLSQELYAYKTILALTTKEEFSSKLLDKKN